MMESGRRRESISNALKQKGQPVTGADLAAIYGVSRQVIVQDIAILRAAGENIIATPNGYMLLPAYCGGATPYKRIIACRHTPEQIEDELTTMVSFGGKVIDVIIEHKVYGELRGLLMLLSLSDVHEFLEKITDKGVEPLSSLTGGVHLHTVEAEKPGVLERIEAALRHKGYLLEQG